MSNELANRKRLTDTLDEYDRKIRSIPQALAEFEAAGTAIKSAATISGTWGGY